MLVQTKLMFFYVLFFSPFLYWSFIEFYQFLCKVWRNQTWTYLFRPILSILLYISSDILSHFNQPTLHVSFDIPLYIGMSVPILNFIIPSYIVQPIIH